MLGKQMRAGPTSTRYVPHSGRTGGGMVANAENWTIARRIGRARPLPCCWTAARAEASCRPGPSQRRLETGRSTLRARMLDNEGGIVAARVSVPEALVSARRGRSNSRRNERTRKFALDNLWHVALLVLFLCFLDNVRWVVQRSAVTGCGCIRRLQSAWHRTRPRLVGGCHSSWCAEPSSSRRLVSVQHAWDMYELPFLCAFSGCRKLPPVLGPHSTLAHTPNQRTRTRQPKYWLLRTRA